PAAERRERVAQVLAAVGLAEHAQHRPDALSGGQRQRVAVARALIKRPTLVIADEPTASLDSHTAEQVLALMRERGHAQGAAFLIATHDARVLRRCKTAWTAWRRSARSCSPTPTCARYCLAWSSPG